MTKASREGLAVSRAFSQDERTEFKILADQFAVNLNYTFDGLGGEALGLLANSHEGNLVIIIHPTARGFVAKNEASNSLGCFETVKEFSQALRVYLDKTDMSSTSA